MVVQTPPPSPPEIETEAGVIEDARARQRRHRIIGVVLLAAAAAAVWLIVGMGGGGSGGGGTGRNPLGQPSGSSSGPAHASQGNPFPDAPTTQAHGYGVDDGVCPLAAPNRYLPVRSGCVTVRRVDIGGDGRPDLVLIYSTLTHRRVGGASFPGAPTYLRRDYYAKQAILRVVQPDGAIVTVPITFVTHPINSKATETTAAKAAAISSIGHFSDRPGNEIFVEVFRTSSGAGAVGYSLYHGRLVSAGLEFDYGGDSADQQGFDCVPGSPPRIIQRVYQLIHGIRLDGDTIYGLWRETVATYAWHGPRLVKISTTTSTRRLAPPRRETSAGTGCT